jgi:hypothetical protein
LWFLTDLSHATVGRDAIWKAESLMRTCNGWVKPAMGDSPAFEVGSP